MDDCSWDLPFDLSFNFQNESEILKASISCFIACCLHHSPAKTDDDIEKL